MNSHFAAAGVIAVIYVVMKFMERKYIIKTTKPLKETTRDTIVVYLSSLLALFVIEHIDSSNIISSSHAKVFLDNPFPESR